MRYMDILIFILCINVAAILIDVSGVPNMFNNAHRPLYDRIWVESYQGTLNAFGIDWNNPPDDFATGALGLLTGIGSLLSFMFQVVLLAPTLVNLGVPTVIAYWLAIPVWVIYLWGVVQFISGRSGRNME